MPLPRLTYSVILIGAVLWCGLILSPPLLTDSSTVHPVFGHAVEQFYHPICHQNPARSFTLLGHPLAVCARCSSIYFSFLLGTLVYPFVRRGILPVYPPRLWLATALLPLILEVGTEWLGFYQSTMMSRSLTGALAGGVLAFFIIPAAIDAARGLHVRPSESRPHTIQKGVINA